MSHTPNSDPVGYGNMYQSKQAMSTPIYETLSTMGTADDPMSDTVGNDNYLVHPSIANSHVLKGHQPNSGFTNTWLEQRSETQLFSETFKDHQLTDVADGDYSTYYRTILKNIQERTPVSDLYFSQLNINHMKALLCHLLAKYFKEKHNKVINLTPQNQSAIELLHVMRSIYLQDCRNPVEMYSKNPAVKQQAINIEVARMNNEVITDLIPRMYSSIMMNLSYQRDQGNRPVPIAHPQNLSTVGTNLKRDLGDVTFI